MNDRPVPALNPAKLIAAYRERRFDDLSRMFLEVLNHFRALSYSSFGPQARRYLDVFVKHFLHLFTQEDYLPSDPDLERFIELNPVISNIVASSSFRTTDPYIEVLRGQKGNFGKLLALYSVRNRAPLDRKALFDTEPRLATQWYFCFWENYKGGCAGRDTLRQLREHLAFRHPLMGALNNYVHHAYFGATYVDFEKDQGLKRHINEVFRQWGPSQAPIVNRPDFRKIALITAMWFPLQSVYRCTHSFVKSLAADFEVTLVHLGARRDDLDTSLFRDVRIFDSNDLRDLSAVTPNDWGIAYYPDIGMNIQSIFLSNLRLAPIQICGYGHPVSTFGSKIDYWLGGRDIESLEDWERNYSERLVLVPGSGVAPNRPAYVPRGLMPSGDALRINCPWSSQKINYPLLERVRRILARARRPVRFRFFTGGALDANSCFPLRRELAEILGTDSFELFDGMPYLDYMREMEQGDFSLDSYPFGGYATATDSLYLRKPMITQEGTKFYNRSAASLLRRAGLHELIVSTREAYEELTLRLIHDDAYRESLCARLAAVDLERTIFAHDDARYVVKAFHYLIENHDRLMREAERRPIVFDP